MARAAKALPRDHPDRPPPVTPIWRRETGRRILVLTGTDVHTFDRICAWADARAGARPDEEVVVQHGFTTPPRIARGVQLLTPAELIGALDAADAVISHGGPGTISTVRAAGHTPIIVPRDPALGEHVDDHQLRFAAWAADRRLGVVIHDVARLDDAVDRAARTMSSDDAPARQAEESLRVLSARLVALSQGDGRRRAIPLLQRARWGRIRG